jgi:hypothetical protein
MNVDPRKANECFDAVIWESVDDDNFFLLIKEIVIVKLRISKQLLRIIIGHVIVKRKKKQLNLEVQSHIIVI